MKTGAVSLGWSGIALPQVFEQLRAAGGECIELNSSPGLHDGLVLDRQTIPQVRSWAKEAGLIISGISGYNDFAHSEREALTAEIERLLSACRIAAEMEVRIVRAFVGQPKAGKTFADFRPHVAAAFRQGARQAQVLGVTLAIENHGRLLNNGPELARLIQEIGAPNVGLTLDTGNFAWAGHDSVQTQADFQAALPYTVNVHVKDGVWRDGRFEFVPAGEGDLDLGGLLRQLVALGYRGAVCSEYEGSGDFVTGTRVSVAYLRKIRQSAL